MKGTYGILPLSKQQSKVCEVNFRSHLHCFGGVVIPSIDSRWRSVIPLAPLGSSSAAIDLMHTTSS